MMQVEGLPSKQAEAVQGLAETIGNLGRRTSTSLLYLTHMLTAGLKTRNLLGECQTYVIFPGGSSNNQLRHLLCYYAGASPQDVTAIKRLPSRWVSVKRTYPPTVMYDGGAYLLNE